MFSTVNQRWGISCVGCAIICVALPLFCHTAPDLPEATASVEPNERFEGYLFLDADGQPLPFQTDEEIEQYLATASLVSKTKIPVGVTDPMKFLLGKDGLRVNAVFKDINREESKVRERSMLYLTWRDWYGYDIAAYRLDRLLGLNRVPPVIERAIERHKGSVQIWLEGVITDTMRRDKDYKPPSIGRYNQQKEIMNVFDNLVANRDSNLGNTLIDENWRLWFIDCSRCFGGSPDLLYPQSINQCERGLWDALRALDRSEVTESLSEYLSSREIDAIFIRRDKIVERIQALIDEYGEIHVVFDTIENNETAVWANE